MNFFLSKTDFSVLICRSLTIEPGIELPTPQETKITLRIAMLQKSAFDMLGDKVLLDYCVNIEKKSGMDFRLNITARPFKPSTIEDLVEHWIYIPAGEKDLKKIVNITVDVKIKSNENYLHNSTFVVKNLAKKNLRLLEDPIHGAFSDFTFIVKEKKIKVHKAILAAASAVFLKLFTVDMEESRNCLCKIEAIEVDVFEHLLRFIYGGIIPQKLEDSWTALYDAAAYYEIEPLKQICLNALVLNLSTHNALMIFKWAHVYDLHCLIRKAWILVKR